MINLLKYHKYINLYFPNRFGAPHVNLYQDDYYEWRTQDHTFYCTYLSTIQYICHVAIFDFAS